MSTTSSTHSSSPPIISSSAQSSPPSHLRHITSNSGLPNTLKDPTMRERKVSGRVNTHLQAGGGGASIRLGSRSPSSIPSSPTSVHSSSSAIFERDIEPITSPSPPHPSRGGHHHPPNPHHTPRSKTTEHLDQSVPSVLDSAAAILASASPSALEDDRISVVAPAPAMCRSGVTSPIGSYGSRSPSPTMGSVGKRTSLLLSIPSPPTNAAPPQPSSPPATARMNLSIQTQTHSTMNDGDNTTSHANTSTPSIVTPTSTYYSVAEDRSDNSSPTTTTLEHPPSSFHAPPIMHGQQQQQSPTTIPINLNFSHPPSPIASSSATTAAAGTSTTDKRLSFMSYSDLLASTPASLHPLSSLTTSASSAEPPPHIPSVSGFTQATAAAHHTQSQYQYQYHQAQTQYPNASRYSPSHSPGRGGSLMRTAGVIEGRALGGGDRDSMGFDDLGGEWEREGMGGGLEERLEALLAGGVGVGPQGVTVR